MEKISGLKIAAGLTARRRHNKRVYIYYDQLRQLVRGYIRPPFWAGLEYNINVQFIKSYDTIAKPERIRADVKKIMALPWWDRPGL